MNISDIKIFSKNADGTSQSVTAQWDSSESTVTAAYVDTGAEFSAQITPVSPKLRLTLHTVKYRQNGGYKYVHKSQGYTSKASYTFYRLVTEDDTTKDSFANFESDIRSRYKAVSSETVSNNMLMTQENNGGLAFHDAITQWLKDNKKKGYGEYTGQKLPLMLDGKEIIRIDMLTVTEGHLNIYGEGKWLFFRDGDVRFDYDTAVYKSYHFTLNNTGTRVEAPSQSLMSGKSLTETQPARIRRQR